ncbi:MAG: Piwi domain-containing protein [Brevinematia bacterium]|jgi:hypothetical protein
MNLFSLYAEILDPPLLRFNYALPTAISRSSLNGILQFGPYDKDVFPKSGIKLAIIYPLIREKEVESFVQSFVNGLGVYPGFERLFRISVDRFEKYSVEDLTLEAHGEALKKVVTRDYDIVFVIVEVESSSLYSLIKTVLLGNGIPCQVIRSTTLLKENEQLQWILGNIALSTYAKVGGTPWVIEASEKPEIVLGMSRAMDRYKKVIVGFTTIFKHNGDFLLFYSKSPVTTWEDYQNGLEELVYEAIREYEKRDGTPCFLVFHFHKRTGKKEVEAVKRAISRLGMDVKYALLHLNSYSSYRIFDATDFTYAPLIGTVVKLSSRQVILATDGRRLFSKRPYIGAPHVLEITMDKESTMDFKEFPRLVEQVYRFSYVNWRGFNARTIPITINYSYLIARLVSGLEDENKWNTIITNGKLMDKAWFL